MKTRPVTLITGGTRGIGAAVARRLSADGHALVLGYLDDEASAAALQAELATAGSVVTVRSDVTTDSGIETLFSKAVEHLGSLSAVVNNAGATLRLGTLADTPTDVVRRVIELNLTAAVLCARAAVRRFDAQGTGGTIVNISSAAATTGSPGDYVHYAAAKAGVDALTLGLARETAARGIRVVGVAPGMTRTRIHADAGDPDRLEAVVDRIPLGRVAEADEIASAVGWLLSEQASYITGTTIRVAGGL
jgi:NAD(P)-dependent dehydrogenase (short-subunit alcohol dehydrogenase family)